MSEGVSRSLAFLVPFSSVTLWDSTTTSRPLDSLAIRPWRWTSSSPEPLSRSNCLSNCYCYCLTSCAARCYSSSVTRVCLVSIVFCMVSIQFGRSTVRYRNMVKSSVAQHWCSASETTQLCKTILKESDWLLTLEEEEVCSRRFCTPYSVWHLGVVVVRFMFDGDESTVL